MSSDTNKYKHQIVYYQTTKQVKITKWVINLEKYTKYKTIRGNVSIGHLQTGNLNIGNHRQSIHRRSKY